MTTRERRARRFQVEALEGRLAPSAASGIGGDIRPDHVAPLQAYVAPPGGGMSREIVPTPYGGRGGLGGDF
jgi:hypothetical protein